MSFCTRRERTARKDHKCFACGERINKGERYIRESGVEDGDFFDCKMHPECRAELDTWDDIDLECFMCGDLDRPKKPTSEAAAK